MSNSESSENWFCMSRYCAHSCLARPNSSKATSIIVLHWIGLKTVLTAQILGSNKIHSNRSKLDHISLNQPKSLQTDPNHVKLIQNSRKIGLSRFDLVHQNRSSKLNLYHVLYSRTFTLKSPKKTRVIENEYMHFTVNIPPYQPPFLAKKPYHIQCKAKSCSPKIVEIIENTSNKNSIWIERKKQRKSKVFKPIRKH